MASKSHSVKAHLSSKSCIRTSHYIQVLANPHLPISKNTRTDSQLMEPATNCADPRALQQWPFTRKSIKVDKNCIDPETIPHNCIHPDAISRPRTFLVPNSLIPGPGPKISLPKSSPTAVKNVGGVLLFNSKQASGMGYAPWLLRLIADPPVEGNPGKCCSIA